MSGESKLQIALKADESLVISSRRSTLIARGRWDAAKLPRLPPSEPEDPLVETRRLAEEGDADAQSRLADAYYYGKGVAQDHQEAARWFRLSAEQGNAKAQYSLGFLYSRGLGVGKDYTEAAGWYRLSADQGNATAQYSLGFLYSRGLGVGKDYEEAARWYRLSAEQGNATAQYSLGMFPRQSANVLPPIALSRLAARPRKNRSLATPMSR